MNGKLSQRLVWWLGTANFLLLVAFRVTGCFCAIVWTLQGGTRGMSLIIDIGSWTIYFVYMLQVSIWEAYRIKLAVADWKSRPTKITIAEKWDISLYGIIMGYTSGRSGWHDGRIYRAYGAPFLCSQRKPHIPGGQTGQEEQHGRRLLVRYRDAGDQPDHLGQHRQARLVGLRGPELATSQHYRLHRFPV